MHADTATPNQQFVDELDKLIIRKFKKAKLYSCFMDSIGGGNLSDM